MAFHTVAIAYSDYRVLPRMDRTVSVRPAITLHRLIVCCASVGFLLSLARLLDVKGLSALMAHCIRNARSFQPSPLVR